jgi:dTDP-4-dehydrorhamnose reductase
MEGISTEIKYPSCDPEVWGGIESTINRIGNEYRDQADYSGHYKRKDDIERFAGLGIHKLRYPVLWEKHLPDKNGRINWQWITGQLNSIRDHNIIPIAGLLHHGSGPADTDLLDEAFPSKLAAYGAMVARQFPWLEYYTPVNEPLTTARFSGLYGLWYPHCKDEQSFIRMLLNQVKAIILSMRAIREINPAAKLIQTEDLSKTHSTPLLSYQAEYENERRWLTYDLLCGKFNPQHYFWKYFISLGIKEKDLWFFADNKCMPFVAGFNYYVTSERYLDENLPAYPANTHGGNGTHCYCDTEAVRTGSAVGLEKLLTEASHRYQLPLAVTESHLNCTREEQLRWLKQTWDTCCGLKNKGIDIVAVTAWSLLGSYDWDSLLVRKNYNYESGVFDVRTGYLRPTSLSKLVRAMADHKSYDHPLLSGPGWWQECDVSPQMHHVLVIIDKNDLPENSFIKVCTQRRIQYKAICRQDIDKWNERAVVAAIEQYKAWAIINTPAYERIEGATLNAGDSFAIDATGSDILAKICHKHSIMFMTFSTDVTFSGNETAGCFDADIGKRLHACRSNKSAKESLTLCTNPSALIIRSDFLSQPHQCNSVCAVATPCKRRHSNCLVQKTISTDVAEMALNLLIDEENGIWHISKEGIAIPVCPVQQVKNFGDDKCQIIPGSLRGNGSGSAKQPCVNR